MDPVLELSTLSVSYLWVLRDVFRDEDCKTVAELPIDRLLNRVYRGLDPADAVGAQAFDFALGSRLQAIAARRPGDAWSDYTRKTPTPEVESAAFFRQAITHSRETYNAAVTAYRELTTAPEEDPVYTQLRDQLWQFHQHARTLIKRFGDVSLGGKPEGNGSVMTLEQLAREIHAQLLEHRAWRSAVARDLDYA